MAQDNIKKAAVIGYPVAHSLSPRLHGFWLKKYGIAGEYSAVEVKPEELENFIKNMSANGYSGVNVTIPHKEAVIPFLDGIDKYARAIGAVNTIIVDDGKLYGTNTDAEGFYQNIESHIIGRKKAVVLGAGGAAKAVIFALELLEFEEIIITNRTCERALMLQHLYSSSSQIVDWEKRSEILADADLLVNTTSLGMTGKEPLDIDLSRLPKTALVTDIVYKPLITPLLAQAQARGNPTVDGLGMLLHQAVPAFAAWFGDVPVGDVPVVDDELRDYVLGK